MSSNNAAPSALLLRCLHVLLAFFGLIYAWSLFVDPLEAEFSWGSLGHPGIHAHHHLLPGMLVAGVLEERTSPRTVMLITAACLGLGLIASAFTESLPFIYATYGVLVGPAWALAPTWSCPSR